MPSYQVQNCSNTDKKWRQMDKYYWMGDSTWHEELKQICNGPWGIELGDSQGLSSYGWEIQLLECAIPPPSSLSVTQIRTLSPLLVFLKHGQLDFSKVFSSISDYLTSIFPDFICGGHTARAPEGRKGGSQEAQRAFSYKSGPGGSPVS